jgi:hypothetical protein
MRFVEILLVLVILTLAGYAVYRLIRWYFRPPTPPPGHPALPTATAWQVRYTVAGPQTVWWIYRAVRISGGKQAEETQEIARIDSAAADFDELFVLGERRAHDRAMLLNSTLSP